MKKQLYTIIAIIIYCTTGAQVHQLWVTTTQGGANNRGAIFTADSTGTDFHSVYDCDTSGSQIIGGMLMAPNGLLYGVTETGGYHDSCVICTYDPITGVFTDIHDFVLNIDSGYGAQTGLTLCPNGKLYGMANGGGMYGGGVIYTIDPTDNSYYNVHHFEIDSGSQAIGGITAISNGNMFGMTSSGGTNGAGVIFKFSPADNSYSVLHNFDYATGGYPSYTTLLHATDGKLYGMTANGGEYGFGVIFSFDLTNNSYTDMHDFNDTLGSDPMGSLTQATDGKLYGLTNLGGTHNDGVLFSFNLFNNNYSVLFNFDSLSGMQPQRGLTQASSGKLFGTTSIGGSSWNDITNLGYGVIFSFDISNNTYAKVYEFDGITGSQPNCDVYESGPAVTTGVSSLNKTDGLALSPNPASHTVTITIDENMAGSTATFTDVTGRKIAAVQLSTQHSALNTSNFANGIYLVSITGTGGVSATKKLVISK